LDLATTDYDGLIKASLEFQKQYADQTEVGITFFMCLPSKVLKEMNGLDPLFDPCFCEDDDLILRLALRRMAMITSLDAICYHYVSKTSRFSEEMKKSYSRNRNSFKS
jgi:GT2 family glycosyltransferase